MKNNYLRNLLAISMLSTAVILSGCSSSKLGIATATAAAETNLITMADAGFTSDDEYTDWENSEYTSIKAENGTFTVDGNGAEANGNTVTINHKGTFVLSGTIDDGCVIVNSNMSGKVRLILNNFNITCSNGAPIYIMNSDVMLSLPDGTTNNVTDSADYTYEYYDKTDGSPNAAIFAKDDLVINGTGTLNVTANHKNAVQSKNDLKVVEGTINVTSVDDGFVGKDMAAFKGGNITLKTSGDAIKSTGTDDKTGYIIVGGGTFKITSQNDGMQASSQLYIEGGKFNITTGEGGGEFSPSQGGMGGGPTNSAKKSSSDSSASTDTNSADKTNTSGSTQNTSASSKENSNMTPPDGGNAPSDMTPPNNGDAPSDGNAPSGMTSQTKSKDTESMKGIKSDTTVHITGGTFNIDTEDDAVHSNDAIIIDGGEFSINTGDDAMHADSTLTVNDGKIDISNCYEGLEASEINVNGGTTNINATDDGVNASEKKTATGSANNSQQQNTSNDNSSAKTAQTNADGTTSANSQSNSTVSDNTGSSATANQNRPSDGGPGDGMESGNAVLYIKGGTLNVNAYGDGLDANGSIYMSGGTVTVSGPTSNGDGALDYDNVFEVTGGNLITAGSSGMAQNPSDSSTQYSIAGILDDEQAENSVISLTDDTGNEIMSFTPPKKYSHLVFSSPKIESGKTYHILINGTEVKSVQVSDIVSLFSEMKSGNGGGPGQGMKGPGSHKTDSTTSATPSVKQSDTQNSSK